MNKMSTRQHFFMRKTLYDYYLISVVGSFTKTHYCYPEILSLKELIRVLVCTELKLFNL